jgi:Kef-type K+ transport system membrane component KefB
MSTVFWFLFICYSVLTVSYYLKKWFRHHGEDYIRPKFRFLNLHISLMILLPAGYLMWNTFSSWSGINLYNLVLVLLLTSLAVTIKVIRELSRHSEHEPQQAYHTKR